MFYFNIPYLSYYDFVGLNSRPSLCLYVLVFYLCI